LALAQMRVSTVLNRMAAIETSRLSSILRGEMHDKALAFRAWTYERSSP
jgi:hypothetical protein